MSPSSSCGPEFVELWPCPFLIQQLPDCEQVNVRLGELARSFPTEGVFRIGDPAIDWLRSQVAHGISQYLRLIELPAHMDWGVRARFDIFGRGDYRGLANRPGAYLGGLYIVQSPDQPMPTSGRDDLSPGAVSFYDPRIGMNMNAIRQDPYNICEQTLSPVPGLLLLWPGFVNCFSHPNLSTESIVRVNFDVQLQHA